MFNFVKIVYAEDVSVSIPSYEGTGFRFSQGNQNDSLGKIVSELLPYGVSMDFDPLFRRADRAGLKGTISPNPSFIREELLENII